MLGQEVNAAEGRGEAAHGFLIGEGDGAARGEANVFLEVGDEGDEPDTVELGALAEESGRSVGLLERRLTEFAAEGGEAL